MGCSFFFCLKCFVGKINCIATNYHDDDLAANAATIQLFLKDIPSKKAELRHYRIDKDHSNSYEIWKKMGSPQNVSPAQYTFLEQSGQLALLSKPQKIKISKETKLSIELPRQGVSLLRLSW